MKNSISRMVLALALVTAASCASASPYLRYIGGQGYEWQTSSVAHWQFSDASFRGMTQDVPLLTHSTADGTMVPEVLRKYVAPAAWVPLQVGFGGSMSNRAIIHVGTSYNASAQLAHAASAALKNRECPATKSVLSVIEKGMALPGGSTVGFAAGAGLLPEIVKEGQFQSLAGMFPGEGLGEILKNVSGLSLALAWKF